MLARLHRFEGMKTFDLETGGDGGKEWEFVRTRLLPSQEPFLILLLGLGYVKDRTRLFGLIPTTDPSSHLSALLFMDRVKDF